MAQELSNIPFKGVFPTAVTLVEVGPRDGFQFEPSVIPTDLKVEIISGLAAAGIGEIQVASFVRPDKVPQMADAERLVSRLPRQKGIVYTGLVLNLKGIERAVESGLDAVEVSISASDRHSRKNAGMSLEQAQRHGVTMVGQALQAGLHVRTSIQCAFGCVYEGHIGHERILELGGRFLEAGTHGLVLADTTGMADPIKISKVLAALQHVARSVPIALHLHDTHGLGLVNVMTALEHGIARFDCAFGGIGGCPFVDGAAGNIATEDTVYLLESLGITTGVDMERVAQCTNRLEGYLGKRFPVKNRPIEQGRNTIPFSSQSP
ncbi:Pyruvate:Oxaloacetate transcarboxylase domain protein [Olavius algarvensis associated proteobacterium Delta 3]|nr:Pyruvate:Oxaloacetate transcarboxylase domain protein [Olavius algarvensis associated proteobacterium Delta 3]CAB5130095.1 Pyruvate:Oxaloacetate transcarboxylase domain protein [Olavius algarvensis associated proteobacterium Delta 3]